MASDTKTLCVDLGTSSMRAALRVSGETRARALELGEAFRSSIDRASIPSAVFITSGGEKIYFGEEALARGQRGEKSFLFETSPKGWLTRRSAADFEAEVVQGTCITQKHLLAGLLGQTFSAAGKAANLSKAELEQIEIRVAHPVWDGFKVGSIRDALEWIAFAGLDVVGLTDRPIAPRDLVRSITNARRTPRMNALDVVEPVAAALDLFENSQNARELCVVIDVGAGTMDMAVFLSVTPDAPGYRRKLIPGAAPRSIYSAGDVVDAEVIDLILRRAKGIKAENVRLLQLRRRQIKETLLKTGKVFEAGVEIAVQDLERQEGICRMCDELANNFRKLMSDASDFVSTYVKTSFHPVRQLDVVFAGGGSGIGFLHRAIGKFVRSGGRDLPIIIRKAPSPAPGLPASRERLAVALGGTIPARYWPVTSYEPGEWLKRKEQVWRDPLGS